MEFIEIAVVSAEFCSSLLGFVEADFALLDAWLVFHFSAVLLEAPSTKKSMKIQSTLS